LGKQQGLREWFNLNRNCKKVVCVEQQWDVFGSCTNLSHRSQKGVIPNASFKPKKEYLMTCNPQQ